MDSDTASLLHTDRKIGYERAAMAIELITRQHMNVDGAVQIAAFEYNVSPEYVKDAVMVMLHDI